MYPRKQIHNCESRNRRHSSRAIDNRDFVRMLCRIVNMGVIKNVSRANTITTRTLRYLKFNISKSIGHMA